MKTGRSSSTRHRPGRLRGDEPAHDPLRSIFIEENIVHYCVANMPGAVGTTSTLGLTTSRSPMPWRSPPRVEARGARERRPPEGREPGGGRGDLPRRREAFSLPSLQSKRFLAVETRGIASRIA